MAMQIMSGASVLAEGLDAQKIRMEAITQNLAQSHTTLHENGKPYQRSIVTFESYVNKEMKGIEGGSENLINGVRVGGIIKDTSPGTRLYNPGHPHADGDGMVEMPNVEPVREMVDMIAASRAYEAGLSAIKTVRQMAQQAINIGK